MSFCLSEIEALARATIGQHLNPRWHTEREGRIFGSSMRDTIQLGRELERHNSLKSSKLSEELLMQIRWRRRCLYNFKDFSYRTAVKWGLEKEGVARTCYAKQTGYQFEKQDFGFSRQARVV